MEKLVAELGAAILSADVGLTPEPHDDQAAYIASWLKVLGSDKRAIFSAAGTAMRWRWVTWTVMATWTPSSPT